MPIFTTYIGTKVIQATPMNGAQGQPGYQVVYEDGYTSWSPAHAFERAYRMTDAMTFGDAILMLKDGKKVARAGWNGKGMWLEHVAPTAPCDLPFIRMSYPVTGLTTGPYPNGARVPWLASQTDMLAEDWQVVE